MHKRYLIVTTQTTTLLKLLKSFSIKQIIKSGFDEIREIDYEAIYHSTLFDRIEFDDNILERVVFQLSEFNFKNINADILGKIYEKHISREERKALGQFYTPEPLISFIIKRIPLSEQLKILDPACGSGGFLIQIYDKLREIYNKSGTNKKEIHNLILKNNIFGFDINPFAVQISATNLVLKDLNSDTDTVNIFERDSLTSKLHEWTENKIKDLNNQTKLIAISQNLPKKYDIVVGNPPYFNLKLNDIKKKYPNEDYKAVAVGKTNIASLFLKKYLDTLNEGGYLGFVVPKSLTYIEPWQPTRKYILENTQIKCIYDIREGFEDVKLEQIIIILKKTKKKEEYIDIYHKYYTKKGFIEKKHKVKSDLFSEQFFPLYLYDLNLKIKEKALENSTLLGNSCDITRGLYLQKYQQILTEEKTTPDDIKVIAGKNIGKYEYRGHKYINPKNRKLEEFENKIKRISKERIVAQRIIAQTRNHIKIIANYDNGQNLNIDTVINIIPKEPKLNPKYLLAIINSKFASYYLYNFVYNRAVRSMNFEYVKYLPIKNTNKQQQKDIVQLVDQILKLKNQKQNTQELEKKLDHKIYQIYNLNRDEIKEIEELE